MGINEYPGPALVGENWWAPACTRTGLHFQTLPAATTGNPYSADMADRIRAGGQWLDSVRRTPVEWILDNGAAGMTFVPTAPGDARMRLFHESAGIPLVSHLIDPVVTVFQAIPWPVAWQCLQSNTWIKFIWDRPQVRELLEFGVPHVYHLPMAAPDRDYHTTQVDSSSLRFAVSFIGGQNTTYYDPGRVTPTSAILPAVVALAARAGMPESSFLDIYYDLYGLAPKPTRDADPQSTARQVAEYFQHKLFYNAWLCIQQRDRFVVFLKRRLGNAFTLIGNRWSTAYGLEADPPLTTTQLYLDHIRATAINLNVVNGNSDSGLNMRHFEITAAGGFLLCNHMTEVAEHFDVGRECDTFQTEQELLEKIDFYLEHPGRRTEIARAGQRRTLDQHLYSHRLDAIQSQLDVAVQCRTKTVPNRDRQAAGA